MSPMGVYERKPRGPYKPVEERPARRAASKAKYREANREKLRASGAAYRAAHREEAKAYYESRRDQERAYSAAYLAANRERVQARIARWYKNHPEAGRARSARHAARKRGAFVENVDVRVLAERDQNRCGICGERVNEADRSVDHILPLADGGLHSYANTRLTHLLCNKRRSNRGAAQLRMA